MSINERKKFDIYGTARIFERRVRKYKNFLNFLNYSALGIPIVVGTIFLNYGDVHSAIKGFAYILILLQIMFFLWSIITNWNEEYNYSVMALKRQDELFNDFNSLDPNSLNYENDLKSLLDREKRYSSEDISKSISEEERRFATRQALYYFKYECDRCNQIPITIKPDTTETCDNCGNF